jgi:hypothetical protein
VAPRGCLDVDPLGQILCLGRPEGRWLSCRKSGDLLESTSLYSRSRSDTLAIFMPVVGFQTISNASRLSNPLIVIDVELR